jgi:hypothetical protein
METNPIELAPQDHPAKTDTFRVREYLGQGVQK